MSDWIKAGQQEMVDPVDGEVQGILLGVKDDVGPNLSRVYTVNIGGKQYGMWGATGLDNQMTDVALGEEIRIKYLGMKTNPKTKRDFKNYEVFHRFPDAGDTSAQAPKAAAQTEAGEKTEKSDLPF